jgi:DNA repair exonuclease SbcCD ATPase subunit
VAEVRAASQRDISAAEAVVTNIKSDYNSEFHQASAELSARSQALAAQLKELSSRATIAQGIAVDALAENQLEHDTLTKQATAAREKNDAQRQAITEEVGATQADITAADAKLNQLTLKASTYRHLITNELGDKAAKADIIKAYMPFLNQKINEYLAGMNMFLGFRIDENFEIEFTSPDRKGQTTFSLSKGQLTRVNLAVLFGLRDVANLKASVDTNLLVMDETIEPLSEQGVREIMEMMSHKFSSMNILVVSQRASEFGEYFKDTIRYGLRGGFTTQL